MTDTEILDALDRLHADSGFDLCTLRQSTTGRGWRLHSISEDDVAFFGAKGYRTPRIALEAYLENEQNGRRR